MFKKIHSNRDPEKTVWTELNNEFSPYLKKVSNGLTVFIYKYPKQIFVSMLSLIIVSALLALTVLRPEPVSLSMKISKPKPNQNSENTTNDLFGSITLLHQTLKLQDEIKELLNQSQLSSSDSLLLNGKIVQLELIEAELIK